MWLSVIFFTSILCVHAKTHGFLIVDDGQQCSEISSELLFGTPLPHMVRQDRLENFFLRRTIVKSMRICFVEDKKFQF